MSYDWGLLISYPRRDPLGPWVQDHLFPLLDRWLGAQTQSAPRLFIDTAMEDGTDWLSHLRESLHRSKYLQVPRQLLAQGQTDGLTVALAEAADRAPEPGDLVRLLEAGRNVKRLQAAYRVLLAVGRLVKRERGDTDVRKAHEDLLAQYDRMDSPLL